MHPSFSPTRSVAHAALITLTALFVLFAIAARPAPASAQTAPAVLCDGQVLDGAAGAARLIIRDRANVVIRNCTFRNFTRDPIVIENSADILIENNRFENNRTTTERRDTHAINIPEFGQRVTIRNNTFVNMGGDGVQMGDTAATNNSGNIRDIQIINNSFTVTSEDIGENGIDIKRTHGAVLIAGNDVHGFRPCESSQMGCTGAPGEGIVVHMGARDVTIERNRIHNNVHGISVADGFIPVAPRNILIRNNWIYDNQQRGINISRVHSLRALNNTFVNNARHVAIAETPVSPDGVCVNTNNLFAGGPTPVAVCAPTSNLYFAAAADARFANLAGADFHLQAGSPAVNAGLTLAEVTQDFDGQSRAGGATDVGADEVAASQTGCLQAGGTSWPALALSAPQSGTFTVEGDLTPASAATAGAFGLASGQPAAGTWAGLAAIVLFDDVSGTIKARNGAAYVDAPTPLRYQAGAAYRVRMTVNVAARTYSASVTPPGAASVTIGAGLAFRETQSGVASLSHMVVAAGAGSSLSGCGLRQVPPAELCKTATSASWPNVSLGGALGGTIVAEADLTPPAAATSGAFGLASGQPAAGNWAGLAAIVLFDDVSGTIKARNGAAYVDAPTPLRYQAGATYHVKLTADVAARTYSASVTPPGAAAVTIGAGLAFRETQSGVASLSHMVVAAGAGSTLTACNLVAAAQPAAATARFAVIGDFGNNSTAEGEVAQRVKSWNPAFVLTVGDNNYDSGEASTIDANIGQYYHEFIFPYAGRFGAGSPDGTNRFFPALGNHDWVAASDADGSGPQPRLPHPHLNYFQLPGNERYYDFVRGPVHIFVVDSDPAEPDGASATSRQAAWLKERLAASTAPWKLVAMHHAPFSSSTAHGSTARMQWDYQAWGATAVLAGHDHAYERIVRDGFPYFVNGIGGGGLRNSFAAPPVSGSAIRYAEDHGAMLVEASPTSITFKLITRAGLEKDSYTLNRPAGASVPNRVFVSRLIR